MSAAAEPALPAVDAPPARVLVSVSGSGLGEGAVRAGKALADAFGADWHAVHIQTPAMAENAEFGHRAADALGLAAKLGATISAEPAPDVATGLLGHLASMPAGHLVVGAPRSLRGSGRLAPPVLRALLAAHPELTVHIAPSADAAEPATTSGTGPRPRERAPLRHYAYAIALVLATLAASEVLRLFVSGRPLNLLFLFPVIATAARFGLGPGLTAVAASVFGFDLFLLQPIFHLEPFAPVNVVLWVALGAVCVHTSMVTAALRQRVALSDRSAKESAQIVAFAQQLAKSATWEDTAQAICETLAHQFQAEAIVFRDGGEGIVRVASSRSGPSWGALDDAALEWSWTSGEPAGFGTDRASAADWRVEPLKTSLGTLGALALAHADGTPPIRADRYALFATLIAQSALALERLVLEDRMAGRAGAPAGEATGAGPTLAAPQLPPVGVDRA